MNTKKTFEQVAKILRSGMEVANPDGKAIIQQLANRFADSFQQENPRFDRARFLAACGVGN